MMLAISIVAIVRKDDAAPEIGQRRPERAGAQLRLDQQAPKARPAAAAGTRLWTATMSAPLWSCLRQEPGTAVHGADPLRDNGKMLLRRRRRLIRSGDGS
jgi:hypothetical protein